MDKGALSSDQSSGDTQPGANVATPKATANVVESGPGESEPLSEKDAPKVMTTPASQYVGDESSGDAHPVAGETSIEPKLEECIEEIVEIAQADNGALLEGDSPHETRYETPEVRMAAQDLLATLYTCMGGYAGRTIEEVHRAMRIPIRRRQEYVDKVSASRGVPQPAELGRVGQVCRNAGWWYTPQDWLDWYAENPLSKDDMEAAVRQWKYDFPMNSHTVEKIEAWEQEDTRKTKKQARDLRNGAWAAYLQQECIAKQLAMSFLKFPSATVHTLLMDWARYMNSDEHAREKARALKLDPGNAEAVREKERQLEVKRKLHSLKHQERQVRALHAKKWYSEMNGEERKQYLKWQSGELEQEIQALTMEHGYGKLPLAPPGMDRITLLPSRTNITMNK